MEFLLFLCSHILGQICPLCKLEQHLLLQLGRAGVKMNSGLFSPLMVVGGREVHRTAVLV